MLRALALCLTLLMSGAAFAQQSQEVTKYLQAAITLYENLEYAKSLAQVQKARTKAKSPDDEARCSVLEAIVLADMGKDDKASKAFQEAFSIDPDLKLPVAVAPKISALAEKAREQVKKMLAPTLAAQKAEEEKRLAEEKAKADAVKAEEDKKRQEALAQQQKEEEERRKAMQPPPAVVKQGPSLRSYSWIPGAAGLLAAGVATWAFVSASGRYQTLTRATPTLSDAVAARDSGKTFATLGWVMSGVAVAGIGAAVVMFLVGAPAPEPAPAVTLSVLPGGGAVTISGSFDLVEGLR
jgi:tetratricopeptide (TPR) repeat protein